MRNKPGYNLPIFIKIKKIKLKGDVVDEKDLA